MLAFDWDMNELEIPGPTADEIAEAIGEGYEYPYYEPRKDFPRNSTLITLTEMQYEGR